jgi:sorbitol-specific phosphotransferase system component IIC
MVLPPYFPEINSGGVFVVMPAEAGIQSFCYQIDWIALRFTAYPAFAGMTGA